MARGGPGEIEIYRSQNGAEIAVIAATWHVKPEITFESLQMEFQRDPVKAWRNYGSRLSASDDTPLRDPEQVNTFANRSRLHPYDHDHACWFDWFRGEPGVDYFLHLDLSKNRDRTGIALVHRIRATGVVVVDFMDAISARAGKEIQFADLRETYVYDLTNRGFFIRLVTTDQWNSVDLRQILANRGYLVDECSADKTMEPYDTLFDLLLDGKLDYYLHSVFIREMQKIRRVNGKKYDHPKGGSKDVSDAVACAAFKAIEYELENPYIGPSTIKVIRRPDWTFKPGLD